MSKCRAAGLAGAPVDTPADIARDPHLAARQMIQTVVLPDGRHLQVAGNPIKLSADAPAPQHVRIGAPGSDNRAILIDRFGIEEARYDELVSAGIVGPDDNP